MKKLYSLLMILVVTLTFSACGDNKPNDLPVSQSASAKKSINLIAAEGAKTSVEIKFTIDDFDDLQKYAKWVRSGEVETSSFMEVTIKEADATINLSDVRLYLVSNPKTSYSLGKVDAAKQFKAINEVNYLGHIISEVARKGSSTVVLEYKTQEEITKEMGVQFVFNLDGRFSF